MISIVNIEASIVLVLAWR